MPSGERGDGLPRALQPALDVSEGVSPVPRRKTSGMRDGTGDEPRVSRKDQHCRQCTQPISGQFVRALGGVYHLDCFRCADCGRNVASKFFSATDDMASENQGQLFPLCETDYFRRLDLLCAKCGRALRGSYITALGAKYHVDHFTCSMCSTQFGPDDSYYEHDGKVYCHFHYSTMFAIQCTGCQTAILKQFVEINRNNADEHWHPECYMIHRYWKIKLATAPLSSTQAISQPSITTPVQELEFSMPGTLTLSPSSSDDELHAKTTSQAITQETPESLLQKQQVMEHRVITIWRVLSAFEESSAACISDMLRHVSSGRYVGGVRFAARFVLHVEVLFSAIDELDMYFQRAGAPSIQCVREARMLCKKIVNFFSLLSHTQEAGAERMHITQELLSLVTGLAHYLKILIRISLTGALRLDQEYDIPAALESFLARLDDLVILQSSRSAESVANGLSPSTSHADMIDTDKVHGYTSLPRLRTSHEAENASDLCMHCGQTVEEQCVRAGLSLRWHWGCVRCHGCRRGATMPDGTIPSRRGSEADAMAAGSATQPVPMPLSQFVCYGTRRDKVVAFCAQCAPIDAKARLVPVTRLEQYAFLLCVALNRLDALLHRQAQQRHLAVPSSTGDEDAGELTDAESSTYRKSTEAKRLETQYLDRHMSNKAHVPRISTVVGQPSSYETHVGGAETRRITQSPDVDKEPARPTRPPADRGADEGASAGAAPSIAVAPPPLPSSASAKPGPVVPIRAPFTRNNTDVLVRMNSVTSKARESWSEGTMSYEEGITLADIPMILHAEQEREREPGIVDRRPLSSLQADEWLVVRGVALVRLERSALAEWTLSGDLYEFVVRKSTFWERLRFKGAKDRRDVRKKGTFGVPLDDLAERQGADSVLGATPTPMRIPAFVDDVISALRQMDVSVEGIFRKNGNLRRLKDLADECDRGLDTVNWLDDTPVQLAALLKKFLRELPEPLLTQRLYRGFVQAAALEAEGEARWWSLVLWLVLLLPRAHRDTMEVLFVFVRWVATFSHVDEESGSRMDIPNLATVLAPSVLYSRTSEPTHSEAMLAQHVVQAMLERQDELWVVPDDMQAALQDTALIAAAPDLTAPELLKRCAAYA
ncbi:hypothetical protein Malapachy_1762 [Malassezia pachydermatis]|uniref:Uncharacterized protein n=1 Tax=Malassezia pachydermatis TaxID=77020 RepID=A0A0M8MJ89_9BASI|nr:hypothetical protein Malapachy_1762 [Malassezia pachydermatis]KOS13576.1 hypothetical protein Malapachy_1762 [Malassezia pachydermatis]